MENSLIFAFFSEGWCWFRNNFEFFRQTLLKGLFIWPRHVVHSFSLPAAIAVYQSYLLAQGGNTGLLSIDSRVLDFILVALGLVLCLLLVFTVRILRENRKLKNIFQARSSSFGESVGDHKVNLSERIQNLERANTVLNLALEAGKHAPFIWNLDKLESGGVYSDRYYQLLGYKPQEFVITRENWESMVHPEDIGKTLDAVDDFLKGLSEGNPPKEFTLRYRVKRKSGEYIWVESKGKLYDQKDDLKKKSVIGLITDVTERVEAEVELKNNEQRFKKIFEADTNGMLLIDKHGKFVMCNNRACQIFGYERHEWADLTVEDLIPKGFRKGHAALRKEYFERGESRIMREENDFNGLTKSGDRIKVQIGLNPIVLKNEKYSLAIIVDMTQRVKVENQLLESRDLLQLQKDKYETIFQNINDGLFVIKVLEDGTFIYREFNQAHVKITGLSNTMIADKKVQDVFPTLGSYLDWRYSICRDSKEIITFQERLEFKKGPRDFQTSLIPIVKNEKVVKIIGISRDITSMLESEKVISAKEQKLRYALDASEDAFVDWDLMENTVDVSQALSKMLGYQERNKVYH